MKERINVGSIEALPGKRLKVLINPHGGRKLADKLFRNQCEPLLKAAHCSMDVEHTTHHKHAIDIAEKLDIDAYDAVMCASGDGLPHEVFNGFGRRNDAKRALRNVAVCQLPGGSGNGMCLSLTGTNSGSLATLAYIKGNYFRYSRSSTCLINGPNRIPHSIRPSINNTRR